jgi:hypothetical protein
LVLFTIDLINLFMRFFDFIILLLTKAKNASILKGQYLNKCLGEHKNKHVVLQIKKGSIKAICTKEV